MEDILVLYKNIKNKRQELGLSQEELAKKVGYKDRTSIAKIETGKVDLSQSKIMEFANVLGVSPSYLMGWDDEKEIENSYPLSDKEYTHITKYRKLDTISKELVDVVIDKELERKTDSYILNDNVVEFDNYKEIPCYPELASAGAGKYVFDDIPFDTIRVDYKRYKKADYAIQVDGDSMEPTFYNGDTLIVERYAIPEKGQIGIFIVDGRGYVKRMGDGELISDNKAYENVKGSDGVCMGKVLGKV